MFKRGFLRSCHKAVSDDADWIEDRDIPRMCSCYGESAVIKCRTLGSRYHELPCHCQSKLPWGYNVGYTLDALNELRMCCTIDKAMRHHTQFELNPLEQSKIKGK